MIRKLWQRFLVWREIRRLRRAMWGASYLDEVYPSYRDKRRLEAIDDEARQRLRPQRPQSTEE